MQNYVSATEGFLFLLGLGGAQWDDTLYRVMPGDNDVDFFSLEVKTFELKEVVHQHTLASHHHCRNQVYELQSGMNSLHCLGSLIRACIWYRRAKTEDTQAGAMQQLLWLDSVLGAFLIEYQNLATMYFAMFVLSVLML